MAISSEFNCDSSTWHGSVPQLQVAAPPRLIIIFRHKTTFNDLQRSESNHDKSITPSFHLTF
ncbi:hypothetical protein CVT26_011360 [Gymnopilus dilepis]|uniref:Uncharacterized protein n=1 Tax=Gymnopilus dilepis TaxID=231916 RepID=A0A409X0Q4_9AGAR|nr:hypothetical protein CVT26_011360 [Gymnopilus dilepis]